MAKVNWINGKIAPPESGEHYVIVEALKNMREPETGKLLVGKGDVEIFTDWYDAKRGYFDSIGEKNGFWKVVAWARVLRPDVPDDIKPKLRTYFGAKVKWEAGKWKIGT